MYRSVSTIAIELYAVCRMNVTTKLHVHRKVIEVIPKTDDLLKDDMLGISLS